MSIFVFLAILIVAFVVVLVVLSGQQSLDGGPSLFVGEVEEAIDYCLEELVEEGIGFIAKQGGYLNIRNSVVDPLEVPVSEDFNIKVAYGLYGEEVFLVDEDSLEFQMEFLIEDRIGSCVGFDAFRGEVVDGPFSLVEISAENVDAALNYSFTLEKGESSVFSSKIYTYSTESSLGVLRDIAEEIVISQRDNEGLIDSDILDRGYNITFVDVGTNASLFIIDDPDSSLSFMFGSMRFLDEEI